MVIHFVRSMGKIERPSRNTAPAKVTVNGQEVPCSYDGYELAVLVDIPVTDCNARKDIKIVWDSEENCLADGTAGLSRRMARSIEALKFRTGADPIDDLAMLGTINEAILYNPDKAAELTAKFMDNYSRLPEILKQQPRISEDDIEWFLAHCGWNR